MYEASDLFKSAISQKNRELRIRATIEGKIYSDSDIQDCSIEESILTGEDFKFGSATASRLEITLLNMDDSLTAKSFEDKEVHIEIGVMLDKFHQPFEYVSMGHFIVEEARKDNNLIKLTGYDKMIYFEKPYVSNLTYPTTLKQILQEVCSIANVPLKNTSFINHDYVLSEMPNFENVTLRMAAEYISEVACGYATINRNSELEIVSFTQTDTVINADNYYSMNLSEYEYGPIEVININSENLFALNPTEQLKDNMLNAVKGFTFKPFTCSWQGNPLTAPGDLISVSEKKGVVYKSFISNQKFTFSTGLKCDISTNAKTAIQSEYKTPGTITQKIEKTEKILRSKIEQTDEKITLEVERINESIASINIEADNVAIKVEELNTSVASLNIRADNVTISVASLDGRLGSAESQLSVQAGLIQSKVSQTDFNGNTIMSIIEQTPAEIKFAAERIRMEGITHVSGNLEIGKDWTSGEKAIIFNAGGSIRYNDGFLYQASTFGHTFRGDVKIESGYNLNLTGVNVTGLNVTVSFG
jgi:hypothetical protein